MADKYASCAELANFECLGSDYRVRALARPDSPVIVIAPHGGGIEVGTSELAHLIAGDEHSLFAFEGLKGYGRNRDLHITSHRFDHPDCLALVERCAVAVGTGGSAVSGTAQIAPVLDSQRRTVAQCARAWRVCAALRAAAERAAGPFVRTARRAEAERLRFERRLAAERACLARARCEAALRLSRFNARVEARARFALAFCRRGDP